MLKAAKRSFEPSQAKPSKAKRSQANNQICKSFNQTFGDNKAPQLWSMEKYAFVLISNIGTSFDNIFIFHQLLLSNINWKICAYIYTYNTVLTFLISKGFIVIAGYSAPIPNNILGLYAVAFHVSQVSFCLNIFAGNFEGGRDVYQMYCLKPTQ